MSKKLLAALIAFSMVGAFGCTESEDDNNGGNGGGNGCTQGARQCKGTVPQMCIAGSWTDGTDCGAVGCNAATGMCNTNGGNNTNPGGDNNNPGGDNNTGDTPVAGATCDPTTYEGGCSADLSKRYYCGDDGRLVEKACNNGSTCNVKGNNGSECVGGNSGEACTKDTYTPSCKADGSEGYYCGSQGTVVTKTCSNNDCYNDDGYIGCGTPNNNNDNNNSGEACTKDTYTPSCKADGSEGYYCGSQGTVVTKKCSNNDCYNNNGYIDCGTAPESCTGANNTGTCINDNANADVCVNGIIKHYTCYNSICRVNGDGTVYCPKDEAAAQECTGNNVSENGEVGQCCTPGSYKNSGCREDNTGTRCDSGGRVAVWTCEANETCQYDEASKWYSCK